MASRYGCRVKVTVYGLWHLGCVTAACLAAAGHDVVGLEPDERALEALRDGRPPLHEPGLAALMSAELSTGRLAFSDDAAQALDGADVAWIAFDTPVDDEDQADVASVRERIEAVAGSFAPGTLVLVSSQVPAGFTRSLAASIDVQDVRFAYSPENLRLGKAIDAFRNPERVVVGLEQPGDRQKVTELLAPFTDRIEWMGLESAEMTKHALNAFLATSVTFANELARLCERVGADAKEVERGLKSEPRIGRRAYLAPGAAFAGGTLARDVRFLQGFGRAEQVATPLFDGVLASNAEHKGWMRARVTEALSAEAEPVVAMLGLTYKPGTSTLRRSLAVELCRWLAERGIRVRAHDPAVTELPPDGLGTTTLHHDAHTALEGATVAVLATEWPDYAQLTAEDFISAMRTPRVIDQNWFLARALAEDLRVSYLATGRGS